MHTTKIKICGLRRECEIDWVNCLRPDYVGFVFAAGRRRTIDEATAGRLKERLHPDITAVGVFVNEDPARIVHLVKSGVIDMVQLHGQESEDYLLALKKEIDCPIIQVISVGEETVISPPKTAAEYLLFDKGKGGTGQTFDWSVRVETEQPFFLAGGLNLANVTEGIRRFHPYAVDVSGGVETDGVKDEKKMRELIECVRGMAKTMSAQIESAQTTAQERGKL